MFKTMAHILLMKGMKFTFKWWP